MGAYVEVQYKYRKLGTLLWSSSGWSGHVPSQRGALVVQVLRDMHKGQEVELLRMKWK